MALADRMAAFRQNKEAEQARLAEAAAAAQQAVMVPLRPYEAAMREVVSSFAEVPEYRALFGPEQPSLHIHPVGKHSPSDGQPVPTLQVVSGKLEDTAAPHRFVLSLTPVNGTSDMMAEFNAYPKAGASEGLSRTIVFTEPGEATDQLEEWIVDYMDQPEAKVSLAAAAPRM